MREHEEGDDIIKPGSSCEDSMGDIIKAREIVKMISLRVIIKVSRGCERDIDGITKARRSCEDGIGDITKARGSCEDGLDNIVNAHRGYEDDIVHTMKA